jgi:hypothetical protein
MNNWCICWLFTHIFTGILIFKGLTARRLYKSFGFKGLISVLDLWTSVIRDISEQLTSKEKKKAICFLCFFETIYLFIHVLCIYI